MVIVLHAHMRFVLHAAGFVLQRNRPVPAGVAVLSAGETSGRDRRGGLGLLLSGGRSVGDSAVRRLPGPGVTGGL